MNRILRQQTLFLILALGLPLVGCGPRIVPVKGKVVQGGKPLEMKKNESLQVSLRPLDGQEGRPANVFNAQTEPDGSFVVLGIHRKGIAQGRYRISVQVRPDRGEDRLQGKFSGPNSPIIRTITGDELLIDLDHPEEK